MVAIHSDFLPNYSVCKGRKRQYYGEMWQSLPPVVDLHQYHPC